MRLYIMRHGETDWNVRRLFQGHSDIPLNENGIALAEVTAHALREIPFDLAFTSPLRRARQTAELILQGRNIPLIEEPKLIEIAFGVYEGCSGLPSPQNPEPDHNLLRFIQDPAHYLAPEGGESIEGLCMRMSAYLNGLLRRRELWDKTILLSTHGGTTCALLNAIDPPEGYFWRQGVPYNCSYAIVDVTDGEPELVAENQICYQPETPLYRPKTAKAVQSPC